MREIKSYFKPFIGRMTFGLVIKFTGTMMDLILPWLLAYMVDTLLPTGHIPSILRCGVLMVVCTLIAVTFNVGANRMAAGNSKDFTQVLRHDLFTHIAYLPAFRRDRYSIASLVSRLTNDTYHVHQLVDKMQRLGVRAPLLVLGGMIFSFLLEPALALILACMAPLLALVMWRVTKRGVPLYRSTQLRVEGLVRIIRENAIGVRIIKALSKSAQEAERFAVANEEVTEAEKKAGTVMALTNPAMSFLLNTGFMLVILVGAFRVNSGLTQPGKIMAFLSYFTIILNAVLSVTKIFVLWSKGSASAQRIGEILRIPTQMKIGEKDTIPTDAHISCEHITFSYTGKRNTLQDIDFALKRGQTLGVIGPTGSGKTTLINLLMRFYDVNEGAIRIAGSDVRGMQPQELRRRFGAVFQNDVLLQESIYENISFLRNIPQEQVQKAARAAQIAAFIENQPEGYETRLDVRGANLSGGQKQRLLIARALAGNPEILVLDDAQSALDYRTDAALRRAIREQYAGTTTIIISQRISAIRHADVILLLEDDHMEGKGTHEELMERCESYRKIAQVQMGGGPHA